MWLDEAPEFLTFETYDALIRDYSFYDWELAVYNDPYEGPMLRIVGMVTNAYDPYGDKIQLRVNSQIPWMREPWQFEDFVLWRLRQVMVHEALEGLQRSDGKPVRDPHDVIQPRTEGHCECGHLLSDNWFDRDVCLEPCGMMHTRCGSCGTALEGCPFETEEE